MFISLDVVNLYSSIPLDYGIESVINFAEQHWNSIENMGLTLPQFEKCLTFVCYNYEIRFMDKVFKQKRVPNGRPLCSPFRNNHDGANRDGSAKTVERKN